MELLSRRDVIKTFMVTSAASLIGNKVWAAKAVGEVIAKNHDPDIGHARIVLSSFPALNVNNGSVRLGSSGISGDFPIGLYYPIIINRITATEYVALDSQCTHAGCVVGAFSGGVMTCNCHGSQFNIRGQVVRNPANAPLTSYPTQLSNGVLHIQLFGPDLGFSVRHIVADSIVGRRIGLTFTSYAGTEYEVRHRVNFDTNPTVVPFSTTQTGNLTSTFITGNDTDRTIYVAPADGFFQVALRLRQV